VLRFIGWLPDRECAGEQQGDDARAAPQ